MRNQFCILLDCRYLPRALVLYRSLSEHCTHLQLRTLCMDAEATRVMRALGLPNVDVIPIDELECADPELAAVKASRTHVEYCWTAASALCWHCLHREPDLGGVTYLDADVEFFSDPGPLYDEFADASVLLSPHRYSEEFRAIKRRDGLYDEPGGLFNTQFIAFRRDGDGLAALAWWRQQCLAWVRDRYEPTRYAGQKYLDELPRRFSRVRVLLDVRAGVAPWNVSQYQLDLSDDRVLINGQPLIFHHFQSLEPYAASAASRWLARRSRAFRFSRSPVPIVWTTGWRLAERELALLWDPYVARLSRAIAEISRIDRPSVQVLPRLPLRRALFHVLRSRIPTRIRGAYWRLRTARSRRGGVPDDFHAYISERSG